MKNPRFTKSQVFQVLKELEAGVPVPELRRNHGVQPVFINGDQNSAVWTPPAWPECGNWKKENQR